MTLAIETDPGLLARVTLFQKELEPRMHPSPMDSRRLARYLAPRKHSSRRVGSLDTVRSRTNSRSERSSSRSRCEAPPGCNVLHSLPLSTRARFAVWPAQGEDRRQHRGTFLQRGQMSWGIGIFLDKARRHPSAKGSLGHIESDAAWLHASSNLTTNAVSMCSSYSIG